MSYYDRSGLAFYDIAVQRWPLPWMSHFRVTDHFWSDDEKRMTLVQLTGDTISFPRMDRRTMKVYDTYRLFKESQRSIPAAQAPAEIEAPTLTPETLAAIESVGEVTS